MALLLSRTAVRISSCLAILTMVLSPTMTAAKSLSAFRSSATSTPSVEDVADIHQLLDAAERLIVFLAMHPERTVSTGQGLGLAVALGALRTQKHTSVKKFPPFLHARLSSFEQALSMVLAWILDRPERSQLEVRLMEPQLWSLPASTLSPLPTQCSIHDRTERPTPSEAEDAEETPGNNPEAVLLELRALLPSYPLTPGQSDECLTQMVVEGRCTSFCIGLATSEAPAPGCLPASGYALSHRLLLLLVARQVGCIMEIPLINGEDADYRLCSLMLSEAESISSLGYPELLKDIFVEHVTLCGLVGYREFLRPAWRNALLAMQRSSGCFGNWSAEMSSLMPFRVLAGTLEDADLGGGCLAHLTDVATGALGVFLAQLL